MGNWNASTVFVSGSANELLFFSNTTIVAANGINNITGSVPTTLSMNTLTLNGKGTSTSGGSSTVNIATSASTWTIGDGTTSTVNLNGLNNTSGVVASGLTLNYNIAANLTLNQANTTFIGNGNAGFNFSGNIGQAAAGYAITKTGSSILTLSGTNSYTGGSTVSGGALVFRNLASKATTGTHAFAAGTTLGLGVGGGGFFTTGDVDNAFANTMTGNLAGITRTATTNIGIDTTAGNLAYTTSIAGSPTNGLVKLGANTLTLSGTSTYTGATTVTAGTLSVSTLAAGGAASNIGAAAAGAAGLVLNGGTFNYTGVTTTTTRGITQAGSPNSTINVAGSGVALTMGASTIASTDILNVTGGGSSSLTLGPITVQTGLTQINFNPSVPITLGNISFNGNIVIGNRGTSTINYADITGASTNTLFLAGNTSTSFSNFNGVIGGFTGTVSLGGENVNMLGTANTYTGVTNIQSGSVVFKSIMNVGAGNNSSLGAPTTALNGTIGFGNGGNNISLTYTGSGDITDRVLNLRGTSGTVTLSQSGTGLLKYNNPLTATGLGNKTLILSGSTAGTGELAGAIVNSTGFATSLSKTGTGAWTLSGTSTYTGTTTVSAGTLSINGNQEAATGAVTVAAGATNATAVRLKGIGTVGGNTSFTADPDAAGAQVGGIHSPGNSVGKQSFDQAGAAVTNLTYNSGSIFEWELASAPAETNITDNVNYASNRGTGYDAVNVTGTLGGADAIFRVVLDGTQTFADSFWDTSRTWTDIFRTGDGSGTSNVDYASIFGGGFQYYNYSGGGTTLAALSTPGVDGSFSLSGNTLTWTAVPEPSSALAGLLIGAGLLRRRRGVK